MTMTIMTTRTMIMIMPMEVAGYFPGSAR
jgi:hypothetical protein